MDGPLPGIAVVLAGVAFHGTWVIVAIVTWQIERRHRSARRLIAIG